MQKTLANLVSIEDKQEQHSLGHNLILQSFFHYA